MNIICYLNVQIGFNMVDELRDIVPELEKDGFFNVVDVDIPYNDRTEKYRDRHYQGSAVEEEKWDCWGWRSVFNFDPLFENLVAQGKLAMQCV